MSMSYAYEAMMCMSLRPTHLTRESLDAASTLHLDAKSSTPRRDRAWSQARHPYDRLDARLDTRLDAGSTKARRRLDRLDARLDTSTPGLWVIEKEVTMRFLVENCL